MGEVGWGLQIGIYQDFLLIIITLTQEDDLVVVIHVCISSQREPDYRDERGENIRRKLKLACHVFLYDVMHFIIYFFIFYYLYS